MGLISNKITREKLQPGDHIYTWRIARAYAHHGSLPQSVPSVMFSIYVFIECFPKESGFFNRNLCRRWESRTLHSYRWSTKRDPR